MMHRVVLALLTIAAVSTVGAAPSHSQPSTAAAPVQVVKIRVAQLTLYDKAGKGIGSVAREEIKLPVPVLEVAPGSGNLKLRLRDGREVWVKSYTVETDKSVSVPGPGTTGSREPKSGSTRGLGGSDAVGSPGPPAGTSGARPVGPKAGTPGAYPPSQETPPR
jgi:hypothetical protein